MSISWPLDVDPQPALLVLPPAAASLDEAYAAIELWEHYTGKTADPSQRLAVCVMMAEDSAGRWAASTTGRAMARQNGKGDEIEIVELWGLVQRAEAILHTVHEAAMLATQAQQRLLSVLERPDLRQKIKKVWLGIGQQMIELRNGGTIWYRTRSGGGGRGVDDVSRLVVDEAQHATEEHLAAVSPTMLANSNPQLNAMGSAGLASKSDWWWSVRLRALSSDPGAFGYVEHSAESLSIDSKGDVAQSPVDVADRKLWVISNPTVSRDDGKDTMAELEEQLRRLGPDSFAREHLCVWDPIPSSTTVAKIDAEWWSASGVSSAPGAAAVVGSFPVTFEVAENGEWSSIGMACGTLSAAYVEVMDHRKGVVWMPERLAEIVLKWKPTFVGYIAAGATAAQLGAVLEWFKAVGISTDVLRPLTMTEYRAACGSMFTSIRDGQVTHLAGQGPLDDAVGSAGEKVYGGAFSWDGSGSPIPISPLVAVTIARSLLPEAAITATPATSELLIL